LKNEFLLEDGMPLVHIAVLILGICGLSAALAAVFFMGSHLWPVSLFILVETALGMGILWFTLGNRKYPRLARTLSVVALALWAAVFVWRYF
jgi:hypothetical protein